MKKPGPGASRTASAHRLRRQFGGGFCQARDVNGIEWEQFSPAEQDWRIEETYGNAIRQPGPA
jgi:hypothetical protein